MLFPARVRRHTRRTASRLALAVMLAFSAQAPTTRADTEAGWVNLTTEAGCIIHFQWVAALLQGNTFLWIGECPAGQPAQGQGYFVNYDPARGFATILGGRMVDGFLVGSVSVRVYGAPGGVVANFEPTPSSSIPMPKGCADAGTSQGAQSCAQIAARGASIRSSGAQIRIAGLTDGAPSQGATGSGGRPPVTDQPAFASLTAASVQLSSFRIGNSNTCWQARVGDVSSEVSNRAVGGEDWVSDDEVRIDIVNTCRQPEYLAVVAPIQTGSSQLAERSDYQVVSGGSWNQPIDEWADTGLPPPQLPFPGASNSNKGYGGERVFVGGTTVEFTFHNTRRWPQDRGETFPAIRVGLLSCDLFEGSRQRVVFRDANLSNAACVALPSPAGGGSSGDNPSDGGLSDGGDQSRNGHG